MNGVSRVLSELKIGVVRHSRVGGDPGRVLDSPLAGNDVTPKFRFDRVVVSF